MQIPMTIDERLKTLAHSVELIAQMQMKTEEAQLKTQKEIRKLGRYIRVIVLDHEARPLALEKNDEDSD
jgi:hypothetical protein